MALQRAALAFYASPTRGELRRVEGIPGSAAADWALWCLLPECMLCQESTQLADRQQRGAAQRTSDGKQTAMQAPAQQLVESRCRAHEEQRPQRSTTGYVALPTGGPPREQFMVTVSA